MRRVWWPAVLGIVVACSVAGHAQAPRLQNGLFIVPAGEAPVQLTAYAEARSTGVLRMQQGVLDKVPALHTLDRVVASIPSWRPHSVMVATEEIFRDERAERRVLPFAVNKLNVYALVLRIADLEQRDRILSLLDAVSASSATPGYVFIALQMDGYVRFYPLRLSPREQF